MKKQILFSSFMLASCLHSFAQSPQFAWTNQIKDISEATNSSVTVDTVNHFLYATGSYSGGYIDFGNGSDSTITGDETMFLAKYKLDGSLVWSKAFKSNYQTTATAIATDLSGNVFVTGYSESDTVAFGTHYILNDNPGNSDNSTTFLVKFDKNGTDLWVKGSQGGGVFSRDVATDAQGNAYVTGHIFDNSGTLFGKSNLSVYSAFVAKLDPSGNTLWLSQTNSAASGSASSADGQSIALDQEGNCVIVGKYLNNTVFGSQEIPYSEGSTYNDRFVAKLNGATGAFIWAKGSGIWQAPDVNSAVTVDKSNNIWLTGIKGIATKGPEFSNYKSVYVIDKIKHNGDSLWSTTYEITAIGEPYPSIISDKNSNIYFTTLIDDTIDFGRFTIKPNFIYGSQTGALVATVKLDNSGHEVYAKVNEAVSAITITSLSGTEVDASGNVYVTGFVQGTSKFDNTTITTDGSADFYITKVETVGVTLVSENRLEISSCFYPNPTQGLVYLDAPEAGICEIVGLEGTVHIRKAVQGKSSTIDLSSLSPGIYMAEVKGETYSLRQRLVVK